MDGSKSKFIECFRSIFNQNYIGGGGGGGAGRSKHNSRSFKMTIFNQIFGNISQGSKRGEGKTFSALTQNFVHIPVES